MLNQGMVDYLGINSNEVLTLGFEFEGLLDASALRGTRRQSDRQRKFIEELSGVRTNVVPDPRNYSSITRAIR